MSDKSAHDFYFTNLKNLDLFLEGFTQGRVNSWNDFVQSADNPEYIEASKSLGYWVKRYKPLRDNKASVVSEDRIDPHVISLIATSEDKVTLDGKSYKRESFIDEVAPDNGQYTFKFNTFDFFDYNTGTHLEVSQLDPFDGTDLAPNAKTFSLYIPSWGGTPYKRIPHVKQFLHDNFGEPTPFYNPNSHIISFFKKPSDTRDKFKSSAIFNDENKYDHKGNLIQPLSVAETNIMHDKGEALILETLRKMKTWDDDGHHLPNYLYRLYYFGLYEQSYSESFNIQSITTQGYEEFTINQLNKLVALGLIVQDDNKTDPRYTIVKRLTKSKEDAQKEIKSFLSYAELVELAFLNGEESYSLEILGASLPSLNNLEVSPPQNKDEIDVPEDDLLFDPEALASFLAKLPDNQWEPLPIKKQATHLQQMLLKIATINLITGLNPTYDDLVTNIKEDKNSLKILSKKGYISYQGDKSYVVKKIYTNNRNILENHILDCFDEETLISLSELMNRMVEASNQKDVLKQTNANDQDTVTDILSETEHTLHEILNDLSVIVDGNLALREADIDSTNIDNTQTDNSIINPHEEPRSLDLRTFYDKNKVFTFLRISQLSVPLLNNLSPRTNNIIEILINEEEQAKLQLSDGVIIPAGYNITTAVNFIGTNDAMYVTRFLTNSKKPSPLYVTFIEDTAEQNDIFQNLKSELMDDKTAQEKNEATSLDTDKEFPVLSSILKGFLRDKKSGDWDVNVITKVTGLADITISRALTKLNSDWRAYEDSDGKIEMPRTPRYFVKSSNGKTTTCILPNNFKSFAENYLGKNISKKQTYDDVIPSDIAYETGLSLVTVLKNGINPLVAEWTEYYKNPDTAPKPKFFCYDVKPKRGPATNAIPRSQMAEFIQKRLSASLLPKKDWNNLTIPDLIMITGDTETHLEDIFRQLQKDPNPVIPLIKVKKPWGGVSRSFDFSELPVFLEERYPHLLDNFISNKDEVENRLKIAHQNKLKTKDNQYEV